jgi:DNA-binding NarL/FixJ family response regulator
METKNITVVVVDDSTDIAHLYQALIADEPDMNCVGALTSTKQLVDVARNRQPDVVLLDLTMPGSSPLELCRELQESCPEVRVVFFSGYDDSETLASVLDAGAWGLLSKHPDCDTILAGIRQVARGEVVGTEVFTEAEQGRPPSFPERNSQSSA